MWRWMKQQAIQASSPLICVTMIVTCLVCILSIPKAAGGWVILLALGAVISGIVATIAGFFWRMEHHNRKLLERLRPWEDQE